MDSTATSPRARAMRKCVVQCETHCSDQAGSCQQRGSCKATIAGLSRASFAPQEPKCHSTSRMKIVNANTISVDRRRGRQGLPGVARLRAADGLWEERRVTRWMARETQSGVRIDILKPVCSLALLDTITFPTGQDNVRPNCELSSVIAAESEVQPIPQSKTIAGKYFMRTAQRPTLRSSQPTSLGSRTCSFLLIDQSVVSHSNELYTRPPDLRGIVSVSHLVSRGYLSASSARRIYMRLTRRNVCSSRVVITILHTFRRLVSYNVPPLQTRTRLPVFSNHL
ncbi:hypothetical protein MRB53_039690 [Persea americana]|nr:hypothetical protein MRB53_039690 [Persea americana]